MGPDRPTWPSTGPVDEPSDHEPGPPPTPHEEVSGPLLDAPTGPPHLGATVAPALRAADGRQEGRSGARIVLTSLVALLAVTIGFVAGAVAGDRFDLLLSQRDRALSDIEQDAAMVALLEDVVRTEGVMLTFNDVVAERLAGVRDEEAALAIVARAAASGAGGLEALRPLIVAREGGGAVDEVRTVYLPHLDSWIDYLSAMADEPGLLFTSDEQQPYILAINATADAFRIALEDLLEQGPSTRAAELAERILDDGFRTDGPEPTV